MDKKKLNTIIAIIVILLFLYIKFCNQDQKKEVLIPVSPPSASFKTEQNLPSWIDIYYSQVYENDKKKAMANPYNIDKMLAFRIRDAKVSIDAALHEVDSDVVAKALIDAKKRGVKIRLVTETDYMDEHSIQDLQKAGVPIVNDNGRSALMHNKFLIIDRQFVWTGSFNVTSNGANKNNNNALFISSIKLAENYQAEFNEMFENKQFGPKSNDNIPNKVVIMPDSTEIVSLFAPENDVDDKIIAEIMNAKSRVRFMAFSFTHDGIGKALSKVSKKGIKVSGVFEKRGSDTKYSEYGQLKKRNIEVYVDGNKYILHHKVIIIDDDTVITGSFNFSKNATKSNDENLLIIRKNKDIAKSFIDEYNRVEKMAKDKLKSGKK